ncbi:MAG: hypothetical protein FRX49_03964 [Trebouxia sp. A1-2]|nr:MAG: hypothetical protein FRX49_11037 [Trebouxia sp. A1-2]KAA6426112.1 MAG: hypothetical protein FRX49_03964 [Trebouxia sp. A1-2]
MPMERKQTWRMHGNPDLQHSDWGMLRQTIHRDGPEASGVDCLLCQDCKRPLTGGDVGPGNIDGM